MKMSNIDHCFDNMFTNPKDTQGVSRFTSEARRTQAYFTLKVLKLEAPS